MYLCERVVKGVTNVSPFSFLSLSLSFCRFLSLAISLMFCHLFFHCILPQFCVVRGSSLYSAVPDEQNIFFCNDTGARWPCVMAPSCLMNVHVLTRQWNRLNQSMAQLMKKKKKLRSSRRNRSLNTLSGRRKTFSTHLSVPLIWKNTNINLIYKKGDIKELKITDQLVYSQ